MSNILSPTTGIIHTAIHSGMTPIDAIAEFVDNSFGKAAGDADYITVIDATDSLLFVDNGKGVKDIDQMFRLGDSGSRSSDSDIGKFGVGSKFGALRFGTDVTVMTVRDGVYKSHQVDWRAVIDSGKWPRGYSSESDQPAAKAPKMIRDGGTIVRINRLHNRNPHRIETYTKHLGMRFMSWLENGKDIRFMKAKSTKEFISKMGNDKLSSTSIKDEFKKLIQTKVPELKDKEGVADGRKFKICYGEIPDGDASLNGIHINFGGRTVERVTGSLPTQKIPSKLFVRVDLGNEWKDCLNFNKTVIVIGKDELMVEVEKLVKDLLDKLTGDDMKKMFEKLSLEISSMMSPDFGNILSKALDATYQPTPGGAFVPDPEILEPTDDPSPNPDPDPNPDPEPVSKNVDREKGKTHESKGIFEFAMDVVCTSLADKSVYSTTEFSGRSATCTVTLNTAYKVINKAVMLNPGNAPATFILCVTALADELSQDEAICRKLLGNDFMDDMTFTGSGNKLFNVIYDKLMSLSVDSK